MGFNQQFELKQSFGYLIMKSLISAALIIGAAVVANATGTAPPPPPPPPPAAPIRYRPPVHYRPRYGPPPSHSGGLESILPLLLLGKKGHGHGSGINHLLPLLLLGGGLGGKGGKGGLGGLGGNPLLLSLLLGKNCKDPVDCVKPNTHNTLCGDKKPNFRKCVCSGHGL